MAPAEVHQMFQAVTSILPETGSVPWRRWEQRVVLEAKPWKVRKGWKGEAQNWEKTQIQRSSLVQQNVALMLVITSYPKLEAFEAFELEAGLWSTSAVDLCRPKEKAFAAFVDEKKCQAPLKMD